MITDFSDAYKVAKVLYIDSELERMPNARRGKQPDLVRIYENNKIKGTYKLTKRENLHYGEIADRRERLKALRTRLKLELKVNPEEYYVSVNTPFRLTRKDWEKMIPQSNDTDNNSNLWFENIRMRSRFELNTAIILDKLGLEFKYEPAVSFNGVIRYPDFVVYLPEFEVCFIIECMGRICDDDYDRRAAERMKLFMDNGFVPFRDFLIIGGTDGFIPTKDWVANSIISVVNSIASESVFPVSKESDDPRKVLSFVLGLKAPELIGFMEGTMDC